MVQRYEQTRKLQWYKRGAAYTNRKKNPIILLLGMMGFLIMFPTFILPLPFFHQ